MGLQDDIEELKKEQGEDEALQDNASEEAEQPDVAESVEGDPDATQEADGQGDTETSETDDAAKEQETLRKQEEYRERQRKKREEAAKQEQYQQQVTQATESAQSDKDQEIEYLKQMARQQQFNAKVDQAEQELTELEKPFKEVFTDYDNVVSKALSFMERSYVKKGMTEAQAKAELRREKILLADKAAANGLDPVEAVYNEARNIVGVIDEMAEELGYTKGKPKTNLQAAKELAKPNAMSGGAGKGASASTKTFEEMNDDDMDEIENMTLAELKSMYK